MFVKKCSKCFVDRPLSEFYKDKSKPDGHRPDCKACILSYQYNHKLEKSVYNKLYFSKNPWKRIYSNINNRINSNDLKIKPYYKDKNIKNYLTEEDIKYLWFKYNANTMLKPEIDRIDSNKDYTLKNCKFIELISHRKKDNSKPIIQKHINGKCIKHWKSIKEASIALNICSTGIVQVLKDKRHHAGGFQWEYYYD